MIVLHHNPLYWGIETDPAVDRRFLTRAFVIEDIPPYRESVWGFRIRISRSKWLHFGASKFTRPLHLGLNYEPYDIGRWGQRGDAVEEEAGNGGSRSDEVRQIR